MKKIITTIVLASVFMLTSSTGKAQMNAMDFHKVACDGSTHHLFDDLNAGHAVLIHYYMPNCGSCPPPAKTLNNMAKNINAMYPGMVVGYAFPYNNTTTCAYSATWVSSNHLTEYTAMDSGAAQVANYGGFGMPTVVLLGGLDHRVIYVSQTFSTADTTDMRDSILSLYASLHPASGITALPSAVSAFSVYPNPASDVVSLQIAMKENATVTVEMLDMTGRQVSVLLNEKQNAGTMTKNINTTAIPNGAYLMKLTVNGQSTTQQISIAH